MSLFRVKSAAERCRELIASTKPEIQDVLWSPAGHTLTAALTARMTPDQHLLYSLEGGYTYGRWGLASLKRGILAATADEDWYDSLEEAFHASLAWTGETPPSIYKFRDVQEWRARPDLWRKP